MTLRAGEYTIDGDKIIIPKKVLEEWRDHYCTVSYNHYENGAERNRWYCFGKSEVLVDLLKLFDKLEG